MATFLDGKFIYGWVRGGSDNRIPLPPPALKEYRIEPGSDLVLIQGDREGGGFSAVPLDRLKTSALKVILERYSQLADAPAGETVVVQGRSKVYARTRLGTDNRLPVPPEAQKAFKIRAGSRLLAVRGSEIAIALLATGACVDAACGREDLPEWK